MRNLGVNYLEKGMVIAKEIYRSDGKIVLGRGVELKEEYILKLPQQGVQSVYIEDPRVDDVVVEDVISDDIRMKALIECKKINDALVKIYITINEKKTSESKINDLLDFAHERLHKLSKEMAEDFIRKKTPMLNLIDTRIKDDHIYAHMVNVAVLSMLVGKGLGYKEENLIDLAKGALVHDIGILAAMPEEILQKKGNLTGEEIKKYKEHAEIGYKLIRKMRNISIMSAHIAYQHHERYDGSGYPRELKKEKITEYGYIVGLTNKYDNFVNGINMESRISATAAREYLLMAQDNLFPENIVKNFLDKVPAYPNGSTILLSDKSVAVVIKQNNDNLSRPFIRVIEKDGKSLEKGIDIDLMEHHSLLPEKSL